MSGFSPLWRREIGFFFRTPIAYAVGALFLLLSGFGFWLHVGRLAQSAADATMASILFNSPWLWLATLVGSTLLSMGLFAEERRRGTLESLMTVPVTETTVVLAKFSAAYCVYLALWIPTLAYPVLLDGCGIQLSAAEWGSIGSGYLGSALVGAFFVSVGLTFSLLTRHPAVAAMCSMTILGLLLLAGMPQAPLPSGLATAWFQWSSPASHMVDFSVGIVDAQTIVWYASVVVLLLFISVRLLEARRLR